jgi:hypothetical protein
LTSAQVVYDTLLVKFPEDQSGHLYAEMATEFWKKYQSSGDMGEACSAAIQYAENHMSDILYNLGNTPDAPYSHGGQSHNYIPWDLCPYK